MLLVRCPSVSYVRDWNLIFALRGSRLTMAPGHLVHQLYAATGARRSVELQIEAVLESLFPEGWRGWNYHGEIHAAGIDVYQVIDSPAAATALHRAGWVSVRLHDHAHDDKPITCACVERTAP